MYQHLPFVSVNGEIVSAASTGLPFNNIGFLYGYGCFETVLVGNGKAAFLAQHIDRLANSAHQLKIPFAVSTQQISTWVTALIQHNDVADARLNIYLTADNFTASHGFYEIPSASLRLVLRPWNPKQTRPDIHLTVKSEPDIRHSHATHKTMSYITHFQELIGKAANEDILWTDPHGNLLESSFAAVCLIQGKRIVTPPRTTVIPSITQSVIKQAIAPLGYQWEERKCHRSEMAIASEIFLCSSIQGVIKVAMVGGYPNLKSNSTTDYVLERYQAVLHHELAK